MSGDGFVGYHCSVDLPCVSHYKISMRYHLDGARLHAKIFCAGVGVGCSWVGFGFAQTAGTMIGSTVVIGWKDAADMDPPSSILKYRLGAKTEAGVVPMAAEHQTLGDVSLSDKEECDEGCVDVPPPAEDKWANPTCADQLANTDNCAARRDGSLDDGYCAATCGVCTACTGEMGLEMAFNVLLGDEGMNPVDLQAAHIVYAHGNQKNVQYHGGVNRNFQTVNLLNSGPAPPPPPPPSPPPPLPAAPVEDEIVSTCGAIASRALLAPPATACGDVPVGDMDEMAVAFTYRYKRTPEAKSGYYDDKPGVSTTTFGGGYLNDGKADKKINKGNAVGCFAPCADAGSDEVGAIYGTEPLLELAAPTRLSSVTLHFITAWKLNRWAPMLVRVSGGLTPEADAYSAVIEERGGLMKTDKKGAKGSVVLDGGELGHWGDVQYVKVTHVVPVKGPSTALTEIELRTRGKAADDGDCGSYYLKAGDGDGYLLCYQEGAACKATAAVCTRAMQGIFARDTEGYSVTVVIAAVLASLFGGALFASLAAIYLNKRREYVYREASLPPPPKLGDGDISLRSEVFSQGSTLSVGGEKSTGLRTERA